MQINFVFIQASLMVFFMRKFNIDFERSEYTKFSCRARVLKKKVYKL